MCFSKGCPTDKLVVGLPLYGRSFTLTSSNSEVGAPASNGPQGPYTKENGYMSYYEVCQYLNKANTDTYFLADQRVPYLVMDNKYWLGYDDVSSLSEKVRYVRSRGLGGVMVWALDLDDFDGRYCNQGKYPLMTAINRQCQATQVTVETTDSPATTDIDQSTEAPEPQKTTSEQGTTLDKGERMLEE